jgi:hypothetical protein
MRAEERDVNLEELVPLLELEVVDDGAQVAGAFG